MLRKVFLHTQCRNAHTCCQQMFMPLCGFAKQAAAAACYMLLCMLPTRATHQCPSYNWLGLSAQPSACSSHASNLSRLTLSTGSLPVATHLLASHHAAAGDALSMHTSNIATPVAYLYPLCCHILRGWVVYLMLILCPFCVLQGADVTHLHGINSHAAATLLMVCKAFLCSMRSILHCKLVWHM